MIWRIGGIVLDHQSRRLPANCGWGICQAAGAVGGGGLGQDGKMKRGAFAGVALDPDRAAHQFAQAFADGEPRPVPP